MSYRGKNYSKCRKKITMKLILVQVSKVPSYQESTLLRTGEEQGAKKFSFTAGQAVASMSFQLAPKPFLISRIDYNPPVI